MATRADTVDINDILMRELWSQELINESPELLKLFDSGILTKDPRITRMVNSMDVGTTLEVPFIQEPNYFEPNISDCSPNKPDINKITKDKMFAFLGNYNQVWGACDIARMLDSGNDLFTIMRSFIARYWAKDIENRVASTLNGVLSSNIANEGGDLFNDQTGLNWNYDMLIDTNQLKGDHGVNGLDYMFMHSAGYSALKKSDSGRERAVLSENGEFLYNLYNERSIIIVTDIMPFDGTNSTVCFANTGAIVYDESTDIKYPLEIERDKLTGNGGGDEVVISRKRYLIHPNGYNFTGAVQAQGTGLTLAETQDGTNWERKLPQKQSGLSFLKFAV